MLNKIIALRVRPYGLSNKTIYGGSITHSQYVMTRWQPLQNFPFLGIVLNDFGNVPLEGYLVIVGTKQAFFHNFS